MQTDIFTNHHRRSIRLPGYDYSQPGAYFITFVTYQREPLFGEIKDSEMRVSDYGKIVWEVWHSLPVRYAQISLDSAILIPNHFHAILIINDPISFGGAIHELPQHESDPLSRRWMLLPLVIGYLKMNTAKQINFQRGTIGVPVWQRNYYEHIIKSEKEYLIIQTYIENNPANWLTDNENK